MAPTKQRILCIDNHASSNLAVYLLERVGYEVKSVSSLSDAGRFSEAEHFDLQLMNHELVDGLEIDSCDRLHKFAPHIPILFYSTVAYPYEPFRPINCRQHRHTIIPVYIYDVVGHASRLLQKKTRSVDQLRDHGRKTSVAVAR